MKNQEAYAGYFFVQMKMANVSGAVFVSMWIFMKIKTMEQTSQQKKKNLIIYTLAWILRIN